MDTRDKRNLCGERCKRCIHSCLTDVYDGKTQMRACVYILDTGKRRPCPAGDKCTAFEPRKDTKPQLITTIAGNYIKEVTPA